MQEVVRIVPWGTPNGPEALEAAETVHVQVRQLRLEPLVGRAVHRRQEEFRARRFVLVRQFSMSISRVDKHEHAAREPRARRRSSRSEAHFSATAPHTND